MLNNRKIRLMSKLAKYEKKEGKIDIKLSAYYKTDYVRVNVLKTMVSVTFGYFVILIMFALYHSEYLIANAVELDYIAIGKSALGGYLILLTIYLVGTIIGYNIRYQMSKKKLEKYFRMLRKLHTMYREEDGEIMEGSEEDNGV